MEKKSIEEIFRLLHISVITEKVDKPHNMIRECWVTPKYVPDDYEELCKLITDYYQYHYQKFYGGNLMPADLAFGQARQIMEQTQGGYIQLAKNALEGRDRGLPALFDAFRDNFIEQHTEQYILSILGDYVNPLDYDLKVKLMSDYLNEYSHVLPDEKMLSAYELAANFEPFIKMHLTWIDSYRKAIT